MAFKNTRSGEVAGCSDIDPEVAKQVIANPTDYAISVKDASTHPARHAEPGEQLQVSFR